MKRYNYYMGMFLSLFTMTILTACGGSGGGGSPAQTTESPGVAISSVSAAFSAFSSTDTGTDSTANKAGSNSDDTSMSDIQKMRAGIKGFVAHLKNQQNVQGKPAFAPKTTPCLGGGTRTEDFDEAGNGSIKEVDCESFGETTNLDMVIQILSTQDCNGFPLPNEIKLTMNGTISSGTELTTFSSLVAKAKFSCFDFTTLGGVTSDITLESGSFSFTDSAFPDDNASGTFFGLRIVDTFTATESTLTINGTMSITLACSGPFTLTLTTTDPIITPDGSACPVKGSIVSSGDVSTTVRFNADGSVDAGGEHFATCDDLDIICS